MHRVSTQRDAAARSGGEDHDLNSLSERSGELWVDPALSERFDLARIERERETAQITLRVDTERGETETRHLLYHHF
jgi:hypothetical protein